MTSGLPEGGLPAPFQDISLPQPSQPSTPPAPRHRGNGQADSRRAADREQKPKSFATAQSRDDREPPEGVRRASPDKGGLAALRSPLSCGYTAPGFPGEVRASPPGKPWSANPALLPGAGRSV